jgi:hypothetical protein
MREFPRYLFLALWCAALASCRGDEAGPATATLPLLRDVETGDFVMVSDAGDSLWFRAFLLDQGSHLRLVRYRRSHGGMDSVSATIDRVSKSPIASHHHVRTAAGAVEGEVLYGAGFEGQARLTLVSPEGRYVDNLRTPPPFLDAAQVPQTLSALDFQAADSITFNYVAPFERRALNAQLVVGPVDTLMFPTGPVAAHPVHLRVSGLEERLWFAAPPDDPRLLRWREETRGMTWTRVPSTAP